MADLRPEASRNAELRADILRDVLEEKAFQRAF